MGKNKFSFLLSFALLPLLAATCRAVDPYDNVFLPPGWLLAGYPSYYSADDFRNKDGAISNNALNSRGELAVFRATYYDQSLFNFPLALTASLPAGRKELLAAADSGIGDLSLGLGGWLVNDPKARTWVVVGGYLDLPTGAFDKMKAANMGTNVYKYRPAAGFAKELGRLHMEGSLKYNIYGENPDNGVKAGAEFITEWYAAWLLRPDLMLGANLNTLAGHDREVNGARVAGTGLRRYQAGPSAFWRLDQKNSLLFSALREFACRNTAQGWLGSARYSRRL